MTTTARERLANLSEGERHRLAERLALRRGTASAPGIPRRVRQAPTSPLSFAQQRFWFLTQLGTLGAAFNVVESNRLAGPLDALALRRAVAELVRRHESLRTTFEVEDGRPVQRVHAAGAIGLTVEDVSGEPDPPYAARRRWAEEYLRPWDLERGPLFRAFLWRLSPEEHLLFICVHHIISDGWSKGVLVRDLAALYSAFSRGQESPLPELRIQYADYSMWQREWVESEPGRAQLAYWTERMAGAPTLQLPGHATETTAGLHRWILIPERLTAAVRTFSQRAGCTPFMTLLGAFAAQLSRYARQREVVIGSPFANRTRGELEGLIGCFMNPLPLRVDADPADTFFALVRRAREVCLGAVANQELPFDVLVRAVQPRREAGHAPLFQAMLLLHNMWQSLDMSTSAPGARSFQLSPEHIRAADGAMAPGEIIYPVAVEIIELETVMVACFEYAREYIAFDRSPEHFCTLLDGLLRAPDVPVASIPMMTGEERATLLQFAAGPEVPPGAASVVTLFEDAVAAAPGATAVVSPDGEATYAALNARANRLAHHLRAAGVGRDVRVGVLLDRSIDMVAALLGVLKAGAAYVPMDPAYPAERLAYIAGHADMPLLLTTRALLQDRPELATAGPAAVCLDDIRDALEALPDSNPCVAIEEASLAYVIYTSGSTGMPKGVQIPHGALANYTESAADTFGLRPGDRVLQFASIAFDTMGEEIYPCFARAATLFLRSTEMIASTPAFVRQCREWGITVLNFPTAFWHELTRQIVNEGLDLPETVRLTILGGERAQRERVGEWQSRFGSRVKLLNSYGPTETTIVATVFEVPPDAGPARAEVPIGRPVRNTRVYVLDERFQPVSVGVSGELHVAGTGIARGYLHEPALTAERFVPDPFSGVPGSRMYRTGDQVRYLSDGSIEFLGRFDQQVKIRGFRVELPDIEAALLRDRDVEHAAVLLRQEDAQEQRLTAYVVARHASVTAHELRARLRRRIPDYMVPDVIVLLDAMPLTPNGKVDYAALPRPEGVRQTAEPYVAPRTELERRIAAIWSEVLRVDRVGTDDSFFDLGGHSLLVIQLHSRLRAICNDDLTVVDIFRYPTVSAMARRLAGAVSDQELGDQVHDRSSRQREALARRRAARAVPEARTL